jgi:hypothetical protein
MKVTCRDKEITSYIKSIQIEVEGETYLADLTYDCHGGYTLQFVSDEGKLINSPQWAQDYEQQIDQGQWCSLEYDLDNASGNWEFCPAIPSEMEITV